MKKWLAGKRFESNYEVIDQTNIYFAELNKSYYINEIKKSWTKYIEDEG